MKRPALAALALLLVSSLAAAQAPDKISLPGFVENYAISNELVLRDEAIIRNQPGQYSQNRGRYRYRFNVDVKLPANISTRLRLASGTGSQIAAFQTFGKLGSGKGLFIERLEGRWAPDVIKDGRFELKGGKLETPMWRTYAYDIVYDPDWGPEGAAETIEYASDLGVTVWATAFQSVVEEDTNTAHHRWLYSQQAGVDVPFFADSRLKLGAGYHKWAGEKTGTFGESTFGVGNRRVGTGLVLANNFGIAEAQAEWHARLWGAPVSVQGVVSRNVRAHQLAGGFARDGYHFGFIVGEAKKQGSWEAAAFQRYTEADNQVSAVSDSEFGEGGTNRKGYSTWIAYAPLDFVRLNVKFYYTKTINNVLPPGPTVTNRLQVDSTIRF